MRFRPGRMLGLSTGWKIGLIALGWLVLISWLHYALNFERDSGQLIRMGYMPVITNLAAPILDYASEGRKGLRFEALKFSSFAEMAEALRNNHIQAAFIIAPLSIVLHQQGAGVKIIYIGNRHESTLGLQERPGGQFLCGSRRQDDCGSTAIFGPQRVYTTAGRKIRCYRA